MPVVQEDRRDSLSETRAAAAVPAPIDAANLELPGQNKEEPDAGPSAAQSSTGLSTDVVHQISHGGNAQLMSDEPGIESSLMRPA